MSYSRSLHVAGNGPCSSQPEPIVNCTEWKLNYQAVYEVLVLPRSLGVSITSLKKPQASRKNPWIKVFSGDIKSIEQYSSRRVVGSLSYFSQEE